MADKKKQPRRVRAVKEGPGKAARVEPAAPANTTVRNGNHSGSAPPPFEDSEKPSGPSWEQEACERLAIWWLNGKDQYYQIRACGKRVDSLTSKDVMRKLRLNGISGEKLASRVYSGTDVVIDYVQQERRVDYAGPLAGKHVGIYEAQGRKILVTSSPRLIEPAAGEWPLLRAVLENLLRSAEADQTLWLYAWLKVACEALRKGETRPGHGLILAGPSNCGKSFVQEHVITPLLGGRSADPTKYLLGKTTFNAEMGAAEHLQMQELPSGLDFKSRVLLGDELKRLIATESHALHPKYCDAITLYPWWRVSLSINDNVDRLKALPALTSDFGDKILFLQCASHPMPMPTETNEERRAFRDAIELELPAFVDFLSDWEIPAELRTSKHAARFGHDHFHHPALAAAMFEQEPQSSLLYILDHCTALYADGGAWGWAGSEALREWLCDDQQAGPAFAAQARKVFSFQGAAGQYLSKLQEKFPDRFKHKHSNSGNLWMISAPAAE